MLTSKYTVDDPYKSTISLKFWCAPRHSFCLFSDFLFYSIDTVFIFGDGLTRLLLRWEKSAVAFLLLDFPG
jgi:hypothetical protein